MVHYSGRFDHDSEEFDSSFKRNKPFTFELQANRVIRCWDEAFQHLSKGVKARLICPPEYAYGSQGAGRVIPPNTPLLFDVQLVDINPPIQEASHIDETSRSKKSKRSSWRDLPLVGDERTHVCLPDYLVYGAFVTLMFSLAYLLYACAMPVQTMTKEQR